MILEIHSKSLVIFTRKVEFALGWAMINTFVFLFANNEGSWWPLVFSFLSIYYIFFSISSFIAYKIILNKYENVVDTKIILLIFNTLLLLVNCYFLITNHFNKFAYLLTLLVSYS